MSKGRDLNARLFLEGRSVPFVSANCRFMNGQPSVATIKVPPLPEAKRIKPRTKAEIFVKDFSFPGARKPWVLLFEGEIYGHSKGKTAQSRTFNLFAMGLSNYWDNAKQYYMNVRTSYGDVNNTLNSQRSVEQAERENIAIAETTSGIRAYVTTIIQENLKTPDKDLVDAIVEVIKNIEEVNPFYRYNQYRHRINDRIIFKSSGNINELFEFNNRTSMWDAVSGRGNGGIVTIRQVVNLILKFIFHDFVTAPCPSKVTVDEIEEGIGSNENQTIGSFLFKPETFMTPPPKCNVLYPDHYGHLNANRNYFHEVTRIKNQFNVLSSVIGRNLTRAAMRTYYSPKGFNEYRTGEDFLEEEDEQFNSPAEQGNHFDDAPDELKNTTKLQDFNFLSHEELLKGIFSDLGTTLPSAQIFSLIVPQDEQQQFFQQATDYLFHKKRLASRTSSTSGPLNLAPVPGFSTLLLDDSDAEQNMVGTLEEVTHHINAQGGGGRTSYSLSFVRDVDEEDIWSGDLSEPPIPPWYDSNIFGTRRDVQERDYTNLPQSDQDKVKEFTKVTGFEGTSIRDYYLGFFGNTFQGQALGAEPIVNDKFPNLYAATLNLLNNYRQAKEKGEEKDFINLQTRRDYVTMSENFRFLGANLTADQQGIDFDDQSADIVFKGPVFDGDFVDKASDNENVRDQSLKEFFRNDINDKRRRPITMYRNRLLNERGFRG